MATKKMIKAMNDMFKANDCTDDNRITVDYCENADLVVVTSFGGTEIIKADQYTMYGLMLKVMEVAQKLYDSLEIIDDFEE